MHGQRSGKKPHCTKIFLGSCAQNLERIGAMGCTMGRSAGIGLNKYYKSFFSKMQKMRIFKKFEKPKNSLEI